MKIRTMKVLKELFTSGAFGGSTARVLWDEDAQGWILDISDTDLTVYSEIYTAASARKPYEVKVFKSLQGATASLVAVGFTQCVVHIG